MWLGKVSYSLYLIHMPILAALAHGFPSARPALIALLAVSSSLLASELFHRWVEQPAQRFGRFLADSAIAFRYAAFPDEKGSAHKLIFLMLGGPELIPERLANACECQRRRSCGYQPRRRQLNRDRQFRPSVRIR